VNGLRTRLSTGRGRRRDAASAVATAAASLPSLFLLARASRESFIVRNVIPERRWHS
jgi:hypothetical protein